MTPSAALNTFAAGETVIILDDTVDSVPATLTVTAAAVTATQMAFLVRHGSGFVSVALPARRCDRLDLPAFAHDPFTLGRPIAAVSVDAASGVSTGISAADRSRTARLLADPDTVIDELTRPGHLVPVRVPDAALDNPRCAPSSALALCQLLGLIEAAVCCELVTDAGELLDIPRALQFAVAHEIPVIALAQIVAARWDRSLVRATA